MNACVSTNYRDAEVMVQLGDGKLAVVLHSAGMWLREEIRSGNVEPMVLVNCTARLAAEVETLLRVMGCNVLPGEHKT